MSTRAKYNRIGGEQTTVQDKADTDIIMRFSPSYGKYISRALTLFFGQSKTSVTIKAAERLMDKALWVAEIVKRKVEGLHQIITITEKKIVDIYEPKEEGLVEVREERIITIIEVTLTKSPSKEQTSASGYQLPYKGDGTFLTKESWENDEKERAAKRAERGDDKREGGERKEGGYRRQGGDRRERRQGEGEFRGGDRRRGGRRNE